LGERGGRLRRRRLGGFWRGGGAGFPIESLALRSQAGWLCHFAWWGVGDRNVPPPFCLVGVRVGKAGFWREIEGCGLKVPKGPKVGKAGFWREIEGGMEVFI